MSGVATALAGLAGVAVLLAYGYDGVWLLGTAVALVTGPLLIWQGARRADAGPAPGEPVVATLAGYPLLTVPVGAALVMAAYQLLVAGSFDRTAVAVGLVSAGLLAVREALAAADVRRYARRLARQEAHFRSLVAGANDLILVLDDDLVVRWQSPAAARLFGLSDQTCSVGRSWRCCTPTTLRRGRRAADRRGRRAPAGGGPPGCWSPGSATASAAWRDTESTVSDQRDVPEVDALVVHLRDVGERRHLEQTLHRMAFTDQLTGLPNRRELMRAVDHPAVGARPGRRRAGHRPARDERGQRRARSGGRRRGPDRGGAPAAHHGGAGRPAGPAGRRRVRGASPSPGRCRRTRWAPGC